MAAEFSSKKRARVDSDDSFESGFDSPEVKRLREDLLDNFDDGPDGEFYTASQELDSFMRSFEEEILSGTATATADVSASVVDLTSSESGESQPDLGYLLEASDDELGLPPTASEGRDGNEGEKTELVRVESDSSKLGAEFWVSGDEEVPPGYDSFGIGMGEFGDYNNGGGEYVALDYGLFDYSDLSFGSSDFTWRPETLPAK